MERNLLLPVTVALPAVRFGQFYKTQGCPLLSDVFAAGELSQHQTQKLSLLFPFPNLVLGVGREKTSDMIPTGMRTP